MSLCSGCWLDSLVIFPCVISVKSFPAGSGVLGRILAVSCEGHVNSLISKSNILSPSFTHNNNFQLSNYLRSASYRYGRVLSLVSYKLSFIKKYVRSGL